MNQHPLTLQSKNAVIYGAGGSLGGAVAKGLAMAGAALFVTGRKLPAIQQLAAEITGSGGKATASVVDALDEQAVNDHLTGLVSKGHSIDIIFNAIGINASQGSLLIDMQVDNFTHPIITAMRTQFLTATTAARIMIKQRSGVLLSLTATPAGVGYPFTGGFGPACAAMENFVQTLAVELGVHGIRVVNIRSGGSPDSAVFQEAFSKDLPMMEKVIRQMEDDTMLKQMPLMADIANVAVFLASDLAAKITGITVDVTAGTTAGLNYRMPRIS